MVGTSGGSGIHGAAISGPRDDIEREASRLPYSVGASRAEAQGKRSSGVPSRAECVAESQPWQGRGITDRLKCAVNGQHPREEIYLLLHTSQH